MGDTTPGDKCISSSSLTALPPEIRLTIFCSISDLETLRSLVLTCSAFARVYYESQSSILSRIASSLYQRENIHLSLPFQLTDPQSVSWEHISFFVHNQPESNTGEWASPRDQISLQQSKSMLLLHNDLVFTCSHVFRGMCHRAGKCHGRRDEAQLSAEERRRFMRALCRWDLAAKLIAAHETRCLQSKHSMPSKDEVYSMFEARYPPWELEQIRCVYYYADDFYDRFSDKFSGWYHDQYCAGGSSKEVHDAWVCDGGHKRSALCKGVTRLNLPFILTKEGPQFLAKILRNSNDSCQFLEVKKAFERNEKENMRMKPIQIMREPYKSFNRTGKAVFEAETLYGWKWARAHALYGESRNPVSKPSWSSLCEWGYALWDGERLPSWGFEIGGRWQYDEDECWRDTWLSEESNTAEEKQHR